jgi:SAM-dependent methyltransferase
MFHDVIELRDFYAKRTGEVARHLIRRQIRAVWPDLTAQRVLGIGYATPFLRQFREEAERVLAFMPAQQGVLRWPPEGPNAVALVDETALPLPDYSMDRVLLAHALENAEHLRHLLREAWRVLMGDGRLLVVAPNRRGLWAHSERTPFGHGHPYSANQLAKLLRDEMFLPMQTRHAVFVPPTRSRTLLGSAPAIERLGQRYLTGFGGVVMIEAAKQIYAINKPAESRAVRAPVVVPFPPVAARPRGAARLRRDKD